MPTLLPHDDNAHPIPALRLKPDGAHALAAGPDPVSTQTAFHPATRVVAVYATTPVFLASGGPQVAAATGHYLPAGIYLYLSLGQGERDQHTHISVRAADGEAGTLYISEME